MDKQIHWRHRGMSQQFIFRPTEESNKARCGPYLQAQNLVYVDEVDKVTCKNCLKYHKLDLALLERIKPYGTYKGLLGFREREREGKWWYKNEQNIFYLHSIKRVPNSFIYYTVRFIKILRTSEMRNEYGWNPVLTVVDYPIEKLKTWEAKDCSDNMSTDNMSDIEVKNLKRLFKLIDG